MKPYAIQFCLWLATKLGWEGCVQVHLVQDPRLMVRAQGLVMDYMPKDMSGEAKRHQVYAQLIKEFPGVDKTQLAIAIEAAMLRLKTRQLWG